MLNLYGSITVFKGPGMHISIFLLFMTTTQGLNYDSEEESSDIIFNGDACQKKILFEGYGKSYHLVMHPQSREVFFSRAVRSDDFNDREIIACHIETKECRNVEGITGGYAVAYAVRTDELFFGNKNGIFRYDFPKRKAYHLAAEGIAIWHIFIIQRFFYYITYPSKRLYMVQDRNFENTKLASSAEVDTFFASKNNAVFFSNSTALYKVERPATRMKKPFMLNNLIHVRQITQDMYNNVYFSAYEGIYIDDDRKIRKISSIDKVFGMTYVNVLSTSALDKTSVKVIIYSDKNHIYRLICNYNSTNPTITFGTF